MEARMAAKPKPASTVFYVMVDTCVWLELAKDYKQRALLIALKESVRSGRISLLLPRTIIHEFARNKTRVLTEGRQSISNSLKRARDVATQHGDPRRRRVVVDYLSDLDHKLPSLGDEAIEAIAIIEKLFKTTSVIETTDEVKLRAAQRALDGRAPFHRQKNGIHDAILMETYAARVHAERKGARYAFVTHNTRDFSGTNAKHPHPDFAACFSRVKSLYFITLGEALRRVEPRLLADIRIEQEWHEEPRRLTEIVDAIDLLWNQVWYNRHMVRRERIEAGETKIVEKETFPVTDHAKRPIQRDIWQGALTAAARVEKQYGIENLGPWDDFNWGMINGKLSALRWVLGDEWDFLDT
jgi:hypothetical protein